MTTTTTVALVELARFAAFLQDLEASGLCKCSSLQDEVSGLIEYLSFNAYPGADEEDLA